MSSPLRPGADLKEQLDWYKAQYASLEADLADFQTSSKDLEEQLERDVEVAEKNERKWKEQVEKLKFEVEEWKTKHKQAKVEANTAHNALQKEITTMREASRSLQLRLRDTEVMNDDYERQARNTETSLEDLESKYNAAIERGVLFEETIRQSEQEREALRIETQRLRDELGDLKVENEITREKLRLAEQTVEGLRTRKPSTLAVQGLRARSPGSEVSGFTPLSPTASTPPPKSDTASDVFTPPSPPLSDTPTHNKLEQRTSVLAATRRLPNPASSITPRAGIAHRPGTRQTHSRGPSFTSSVSAATAASDARGGRPMGNTKTRGSHAAERLPRSESLCQIRGLIGRMQKIEERVQNARSKLPAPGGGNTTPRDSPRPGSSLGGNIPSSVTVRRSSRRTGMRGTSSMADDDSSVMQEQPNSAITEGGRRESHVKRLSYGLPGPASRTASRSHAPARSISALEQAPSIPAANRPSSRAGMGMASLSIRSASRMRAGSGLGRSLASLDNSRSSSAYGHRTRSSVSETTSTSTPLRQSAAERSGLPTSAILSPPAMSFSKSTNSGLRHPRASSSRASNHYERVRKEGHDNSVMRPPPSRNKAQDIGETF